MRYVGNHACAEFIEFAGEWRCSHALIERILATCPAMPGTRQGSRRLLCQIRAFSFWVRGRNCAVGSGAYRRRRPPVFNRAAMTLVELRPHLPPSPVRARGKLYRALTLGGAATFAVRRQSHPRDPPQGYAEFQRTMAKKCLKHGHFAERGLPAIMGANLSIAAGAVDRRLAASRRGRHCSRSG
jgi:hypothetical protein